MVPRLLLIALCSAALSQVASAQEGGRLLFEDEVVVPAFPFQAQVDSAWAAWQKAYDEALKEAEGDFVCIYPPEPSVELFAAVDSGEAVPWKTYLQRLQPQLPDSVLCLVTLDVEWTGQISAARIMRCKGGEITDAELIRMIRPLHGKWQWWGRGQFPLKVTVPFIKRKKDS